MFDLPEETVNISVIANAPLLTPTTAPLPSTLSFDQEAEICSGKSFDAFLQTKNGSIYAFRGEIALFGYFSHFLSGAVNSYCRCEIVN